jgi:hypothetical protein
LVVAVANGALLFAVQVEKIPQVFGEIVDCVDGKLDSEVCVAFGLVIGI